MWMVATVSRKPAHVCIVSMVPMVPGSESSAIEAENWAESAITTTPEKKARENTSQGAAPNEKPMMTAQIPLDAIAPMVSAVRPTRSASKPPKTAPNAPPTPITTKAASRDQSAAASRWNSKLACKKRAIHAHMA